MDHIYNQLKKCVKEESVGDLFSKRTMKNHQSKQAIYGEMAFGEMPISMKEPRKKQG